MLPPWVIVLVAAVVVAAFVLPRLAEASDAAAKLLGPLGRYWRKRGKLRERRHREEVQDEAQQLAEKIVAKVAPADYQEMGRRVENMDGRVRALERKNEIKEAFIVYDAEWHFDDDLAAVGHPECKPAFRLTYARFEELYESGWRPGQQIPT